ncbi:MAG: hypothetical protein HQM09_04730, partial [Candidatus Riflebacteria bacterium]|nr:hypothetical protein [Candidatus Riflebacteria bacterium]
MNIGKFKGSAFSLLELIVVVCILGAMVLVAMPYYSNYTSDTRHAVMESNHKTLRNVLMEYHADRGDYPHSADALNILWSGSTRYVLNCPADPEADAVASWGYVYYPAVGSNSAYYMLAPKYEALVAISTGSAPVPTPTPTAAPVPPAVPTINVVTTPTSTTPQSIGGTKSADSATIWVNGITTGVTYPDSTHWSYSLPLAEGVNPIGVYARSAAGLNSGIAHSSITRNTVAPTMPTINPVIALTVSSSQTISGTNDNGATVWVNGVAATVTGTTWTYNMPLPIEGANAISVVAKDALLNTSAAATSSITKDTTAPVVTLAAVTTPTNVTPQTISGTTESGATVWVNGIAATVTGTNWTYSMALPTEGANAISVVAKDALLNTSNPVTSSITKDTTAPVLTLAAVTTPTNVTPQTISGTTESGATVWVNGIAATVTGTNWTYSMALPTEGANAISVVAKDALLNTSSPVTSSITKDTTAPTQPTIDAVTTPTSNANQTITGTKVADAATIWVNGAAATIVDATHWSYLMALAAGANSISVTAKDAAGNESSAATTSIGRSGGTPPDVPIINAVTTPTSVTSQTITGTKVAAAITILVNGNAATIVDATHWSYILPLVEGSNSISVVGKDAFNNTSSPANSTIVLDTTGPTQPTIAAVTTPTNVTPQTISGTTESGTTVWVNGNAATVTGTNWTYSMALPTEGANAISVVAKDALLNTSSPVTSSITKDTTAPAVTLNAVTTPTNVTPQTISGTTESGATVWVNGNAATVVGSNWTYSMALPTEGANAISVVAKDTLLNTSNPVTSSITKDTTAPVLTLAAVTTPTNVT